MPSHAKSQHRKKLGVKQENLRRKIVEETRREAGVGGNGRKGLGQRALSEDGAK